MLREETLLNSFEKQSKSNIISFEEAIQGSVFNINCHADINQSIVKSNMDDNDNVGKILNKKDLTIFSGKTVNIETRDKSTCGSSSDLLFSGYFGQKAEDETFNGNSLYNNTIKNTNPFPLIEEEKTSNNCNLSFNAMSRFSTKRQKLEGFNTSSSSRNYFTELVKSVSLGSLQRKKSISKII